jgi:predicted MFS family arabinose efflux permease
MQLSASNPAPTLSQESIRRGYQTYVLVLLMLVQALSYLDRTALNILVEPIRREFDLTDWQIGALVGPAFALLYALMGIPIARIAEHASRPRVIALAITLWSAATLTSGMASSFAALAVSRLVIGVGEGGCTPAAHSLICEIVPRERRAGGLALYSAGISLGTLLGLSLGGLIADAYGWHRALLCAGAPGLLVALLVLATIPEPRDRIGVTASLAGARAPAWSQAMTEIAAKPVFWLISVAASMVALNAYARGAFMSSFYLRTASVQLDQLARQIAPVVHHTLGAIGLVGLILGLSGGICGLCGALFGGWLTDRLARSGLHAYATLPLVTCLLSIPFNIAAVATTQLIPSLILLSMSSFINPMALGATFAAVQSIVRPKVRATASAVLLFTMTLIGAGLVPLVGLLSDHLSSTGLSRGEGLRWALIYAQITMIAGAALFWRARRRMAAAIVS